jgi:hypothetical protein
MRENPLLQNTKAAMQGPVLVVAHERDKVIPAETSDVYIEAFGADKMMAKGFSHAVSRSDITDEQLADYHQHRIVNTVFGLFGYNNDMIEHESILGKLDKLGLPAGGYMVMGSGILDALGIRSASDVDLVVKGEVYAHLKDIGWKERVASNGSPGIEHDIFQAYDHWNDEGVVKTLEELILDAEWVNGRAYNSLAKLSLYKIRRGREKDIADLKLISWYLERQ